MSPFYLCSGTALCLKGCLAASLGDASSLHQLWQPKLFPNTDKFPPRDKITFTHIDNHLFKTILAKRQRKSNIYSNPYALVEFIILGFTRSFCWRPWFPHYRIKLTLLSPRQANGSETRCWGKECNYLWKACRPRLQTNVSKQPSYSHLDARFFYRTEMGGGVRKQK